MARRTRTKRGDLGACGSLAALLLASSAWAQEAVESRWVSYRGGDGLEVHAELFSPSTPAAGVLLLHQCDRDPELPNRLLPLAELLAARGLRVLVPDLRGYGQSVDADERYLLSRDGHSADARAGLQFLAALDRTPGSRIAALGASCSGRSVAQLASEEPPMSAIVLLSASLRQTHLDSLAAFEGPILCVAAEGDTSGRSFQSTAEACANSGHRRSAPFVRPGNDHGAPLLTTYPELGPGIADWLVGALSSGARD